jgi:hypothetical protein
VCWTYGDNSAIVVARVFIVREGTSGERTCSVYQALQFLLGAHVPVGQVSNMSGAMRHDIWILGILHAPAKHVRHCSQRNPNPHPNVNICVFLLAGRFYVVFNLFRVYMAW